MTYMQRVDHSVHLDAERLGMERLGIERDVPMLEVRRSEGGVEVYAADRTAFRQLADDDWP
jgi:hypothetical protein